MVELVYECRGCKEAIVWEYDGDEQKRIKNCSCVEDAGMILHTIW